VLKRTLVLLLAFPAALVLITLGIANRHPVQMVIDPFRPEAPLLSLSLPFFVYLFAALVAGVILGGLATWMNQSRYRRDARQQTIQAKRWHAEADRLSRERDSAVSQKSNPLLTSRRDAA
jgi:uncharacterized integral membrane protein